MARSVVQDLVARLESLHRSGAIAEQLAEVRRALQQTPEDPDVQSIASAILIDGGSRLSQIDAISQGISLIETLLQDPRIEDHETFRQFQYNLANGYAGRAQLQQSEDDRASDESRTRALFQGFLLDADQLEPELHGKALTNYGNFLDSRARVFEAVDAYAEVERVQSDHPMALFNCAKALRYALPLSGRHWLRNLFEAWDRLDRACQFPDEIIDLSGHVALDDARLAHQEVTDMINDQVEGGLDEFRRRGDQHRVDHGADCHDLLRLARIERLLVTFNQFPGPCGCELQDDAFLDRLFVRLDDRERFSRLASVLNSVKEDIASSRYLYFSQSVHEDEIRAVSSGTLYADTSDLAHYGVAVGLLKAALRIAVDSLDKIGVFLNIYFQLGHTEKRVNFRNVWYAHLSRMEELHPSIAEEMDRNWLLRALYDLSCDWRQDDFPKRLRSARDAATHRGLTLYYLGPRDSDLSNWSTESFTRAAAMAIRTARASTLYLISAIQGSEYHLGRDFSEGVIAPTPFRLGRGIGDGLSDETCVVEE